MQALRALLTTREGAVTACTAALNELRALIVACPPQLRERLQGLPEAALLTVCARLRPGAGDSERAALALALRSLALRARTCQSHRAPGTPSVLRLTLTIMRRVLVLAVGALALVATARPAGGAPDGHAVEGSCGTDTLVVVFWPRGHVAIPQLGFQRTARPRLAVLTYEGPGTFQKAFVVATVTGGGGGKLVSRCARVSDHATLQALPARLTSEPAAITCRTRGRTLVQLRKITDAGMAWELRLIEAPDRLVLRALLVVSATGSNVTQSLRRCRVGPAPPRTSL